MKKTTSRNAKKKTLEVMAPQIESITPDFNVDGSMKLTEGVMSTQHEGVENNMTALFRNTLDAQHQRACLEIGVLNDVINSDAYQQQVLTPSKHANLMNTIAEITSGGSTVDEIAVSLLDYVEKNNVNWSGWKWESIDTTDYSDPNVRVRTFKTGKCYTTVTTPEGHDITLTFSRREGRMVLTSIARHFKNGQ